MTIIKSYTDLEQSKVLATILPLESADMYYLLMPDGVYNHYPLTGWKNDELQEPTDLPCWSLAALINICEGKYLSIEINKRNGDIFMINDIDGTPKGITVTTGCKNPVDAVYNMIIYLHKINLL